MQVRELDSKSMDNMSKSARYKYNHFHRLPEEITVSIFNKVGDLKCLCYCSLVSKQFAKAVFRVQTVSVTIHGDLTHDEEPLEYMRRFSKLELDDYIAKRLHPVLGSFSLRTMRLPVFLDKLTELKCVYLNYDYAEQSSEAKFPKCKIKFCPNGTMFESFVALESLRMHRDNENGEVKEDLEDIVALFERVKESWGQFLVRFLDWISFVAALLTSHASLRRVTITCSEVHVKLDIGDEEGVNLHIGVLTKLLTLFYGCRVKYGWAPSLQLPMSGYVMRWVALAIVYLPDNSGAQKLDEIDFWHFNNELPVFREGVKEFIKKHHDKLEILK